MPERGGDYWSYLQVVVAGWLDAQVEGGQVAVLQVGQR
jgi:hypothetical protein